MNYLTLTSHTALRRLFATLILSTLLTGGVYADTTSIAVLGSSTAAGTGASQTSNSWVGLLQTWLMRTKGEKIINFAAPGILSSSALCTQEANSNLMELISPTRNIDKALKLGANRLILAFPSNDTTNGIPAEQTINNFLDMRLCAQSSKVQVAVMSSLPRSGLSKKQNAAIAQIDAAMQKEFGHCFINMRSALADSSDENPRRDLSAGDGVHFNDAGHAVIFATVKRFMESGKCF
jgi:lysophospholipase L1-like esterase